MRYALLILILILLLVSCEKPETILLYCEGYNPYMSKSQSGYWRVDLKNRVILDPDDPNFEYGFTTITDNIIIASSDPDWDTSPTVELDRRSLKLEWRSGEYSITYDCKIAPNRQI